ncbi:MAG TPA: MFS transporter, partial [Gemmataceae bacterium]|nr:MFS transporter [Gemmataceae bacterium]
RWQGVTVAALFTGYAGYYVCRTVLAVASTGMMNDPTSGIDEVGYGRLVAVGIYLYALGKLLNGVFAEYVGGRAVFLLGMGLSAACMVAFGFATGVSAMLVLWAANRLVQSMGWLGLVRVTGRWFTPGRLATVMGVLSLSYLFGAAIAQAYLSAFVKAGLAWRDLFFVAAGTLGLIAVACYFLVKESPRDVGLPEPPPPPRNVYGEDDHGHGRVSLRKLLGPLLSSRMFWLVCVMNMGLTAIRETFNAWTPRYLEKGVGLDAKDVGLLASLFPLCGAVACLAAGWGADRLKGRFGRILVPAILLTTITLGVLVAVNLQGKASLALVLISGVALFVMGPYTFCSGVLAMNLGGKRGAAASAGIIDAVGYFCGAIVSGEVAGHLVKRHGFTPLLDVLFWLAVATLVVSVVYWILEERRFVPPT